MMRKNRSTSISRLKLIAFLPLISFLFYAFAERQVIWTQKKTVLSILDSQVQDTVRNWTEYEFMKAICNDHEMMPEMMKYMMQNDHAMQMIGSNHQMMKQMMGNKKIMMGMMENDTMMTKMMMGNTMTMMEEDSAMCSMMGNKHMMGMMQNVRQHGRMMTGGIMQGKNEEMMKEGDMKGIMKMCSMRGSMHK